MRMASSSGSARSACVRVRMPEHMPWITMRPWSGEGDIVGPGADTLPDIWFARVEGGGRATHPAACQPSSPSSAMSSLDQPNDSDDRVVTTAQMKRERLRFVDFKFGRTPQ